MTVCCLAAALAGTAAGQQRPLPGSADEPAADEGALPRYGVEIILFTYGPEVSAGTEIFVPDEPPAAIADDVFSGTDSLPGGPPPAAEPGMRRDPGGMPPPGVAADERIPVYGDMVLLPGDRGLDEEELVTVPGAHDIELRVMTPDELTMTDIHEKLLRLDAYRPVLWSGWTQIVREDVETPEIRLRRLGKVPLDFSGDLKLYLGRFLHLVVDLGMEPPSSRPDLVPRREYGERAFRRRFADDPGGGRPAPIRYRIAEDRIMKGGDLRYFDHPRFGLLAKLTRLEADAGDLPEGGASARPDGGGGAPVNPAPR